MSLSEGSVMVPEIVPPATWAHTAMAERIVRIREATKTRPDKYTAEKLRKDTDHLPGTWAEPNAYPLTLP
jgi:hypothetical protein